MDAGDPVTLATIAGTVVGTALATLAAKLGIERVGRSRRSTEDRDDPERRAGESVVSRREAAEMVAEAERMARIEHNTETILQKQKEHADADERRFAEHADRLAEAEWRLHKHGSAIMAQGATLDSTRENLGIATTPGEEPGRRWERMVTAPRPEPRRPR